MKNVVLGLARNEHVKRFAVAFPPARAVVDRFVPGETTDDALDAVRRLSASGIHATLDHLGEYAGTTELVDAQVAEYLRLLERLGAEGLSGWAEVSVKASALGLGLPDGQRVSLANALRICAAADAVGTTVTIDMEDHADTDATIALVEACREEFPRTGGVLQAMLKRTTDDCLRLSGPGSRIRICKGAYDEPASVAHTKSADIKRAYLTCLRILLRGDGYPMIATHDPALIKAAQEYLDLLDRPVDSYEFQLLYGVRPGEEPRLAAAGHTVRVYVPYGTDWYGYFVRRLAEKPSNFGLLVRALLSRA